MIVSAILILLVLALLLVIARCIKLCVFTLSVIIIFVYLTATGILPFFLLTPLQVPYVTQPDFHWQQNNAIVLLGGGAVQEPLTYAFRPSPMAYSRITEAARLYLACMKASKHCHIIVSGSEGRSYRNLLVELGVSVTDIILETKSLNTYQNAKFTAPILKDQQSDYIVLVTSGFHLRRSLGYFAEFGVYPIADASDILMPFLVWTPSTYNLMVMNIAVHEYLGMAQAAFLHRFGSVAT